MTKKPIEQTRKVPVLVGFTKDELKFLDRKIDVDSHGLESRSAIIRNLVRVAMANPEILEFKPLRKNR